MYRAITLFTDLQDNNYKYNPGDEYPRVGLKPSKDRIEELLTSKNRRNKPMIEEVKIEKAEMPIEEPIVAVEPTENPTEVEETIGEPKPKRKRNKKAPEGE